MLNKWFALFLGVLLVSGVSWAQSDATDVAEKVPAEQAAVDGAEDVPEEGGEAKAEEEEPDC